MEMSFIFQLVLYQTMESCADFCPIEYVICPTNEIVFSVSLFNHPV